MIMPYGRNSKDSLFDRKREPTLRHFPLTVVGNLSIKYAKAAHAM